ncbi:MAG: hypothetical protein A2289_02485 [Deltaproteobacteria bacterium RIFOXYA12_FULL_58_15]|nr:MAG: hypothetical protein A2289_02485 [Deltaproteobacteria bacterium RIFOXYA12_FULL_58_15]OGR09260.1 MAG: hypothetical protein A2341_24255 [Deltaproteobacteria bacterium RIFOXYB12_FULL_58_9]
MPTVRPFRFTGLKRYTSDQVAVRESFATYLSYKPFAADFKGAITQVLERYLKSPCDLGGIELKSVSRAELGALVPAAACIAIVGAAPAEQKILVEIDPQLAAFAIDRLLGGAGDTGRILRPLTEIETGVLSFLALKVVSLFHSHWETGQELSLSLDGFASTLEEVQAHVDAEAGFHMLGVRLVAGDKSGYARVMLPDSLITQSFASPLRQHANTDLELTHMRGNIKRIGQAVVECRVEAATVDLGPEDIANLEVGDIVILENHEVTKTSLGPEGMVFLRIGLGKNGGVRGRLISDSDRVQFKIVEIITQEQPLEDPMANGNVQEPMDEEEDQEDQAAPADNLSETQGLLRDVPAPVVIELGRIRLNTTQVARLRTGQILRLPRGPNDPVDLVVNGKLFARGELIEVDGELGVRLLQVAPD